MVKNPPAIQETHVQLLGGEDPLEKGMATHSSILARRNINKLRYADDTILMAESEEELKSLLMKVKEEGLGHGEDTTNVFTQGDDYGKR